MSSKQPVTYLAREQFFNVISQDDKPTLMAMLKSGVLEVSTETLDGLLPLSVAMKYDSIDCFAYLLSHANPLLTSERSGENFMHHIPRESRCLNHLISIYLQNPSAFLSPFTTLLMTQNQNTWNSLHVLASKGYWKAMDYVLSYLPVTHKILNQTDYYGQTVLSIVASTELSDVEPRVIRLIVEKCGQMGTFMPPEVSLQKNITSIELVRPTGPSLDHSVLELYLKQDQERRFIYLHRQLVADSGYFQQLLSQVSNDQDVIELPVHKFTIRRIENTFGLFYKTLNYRDLPLVELVEMWHVSMFYNLRSIEEKLTQNILDMMSFQFPTISQTRLDSELDSIWEMWEKSQEEGKLTFQFCNFYFRKNLSKILVNRFGTSDPNNKNNEITLIPHVETFINLIFNHRRYSDEDVEEVRPHVVLPPSQRQLTCMTSAHSVAVQGVTRKDFQEIGKEIQTGGNGRPRTVVVQSTASNKVLAGTFLQHHFSRITPRQKQEIDEILGLLMQGAQHHSLLAPQSTFSNTNNSEHFVLFPHYTLTLRTIQLELPDLLMVFEKVLRALSFLHQKGIVHGNVSADTILFTPDGKQVFLGPPNLMGGPAVDNVDMWRNEEEGVKPNAKEDSMLLPLSAALSAPELVSEAHSSKSDIFAVGVLFMSRFLAKPQGPSASYYFQIRAPRVTYDIQGCPRKQCNMCGCRMYHPNAGNLCECKHVPMRHEVAHFEIWLHKMCRSMLHPIPAERPSISVQFLKEFSKGYEMHTQLLKNRKEEEEARIRTAQREKEEHDRKVREEQEQKVREEQERKMREQKEREELEQRLQQEKDERERHRLERERQAHEERLKKEREVRERQEREEKERQEQKERERRERVERERREHEKRQQEERDRKEREERARIQREQREREQRERYEEEQRQIVQEIKRTDQEQHELNKRLEEAASHSGEEKLTRFELGLSNFTPLRATRTPISQNKRPPTHRTPQKALGQLEKEIPKQPQIQQSQIQQQPQIQQPQTQPQIQQPQIQQPQIQQPHQIQQPQIQQPHQIQKPHTQKPQIQQPQPQSYRPTGGVPMFPNVNKEIKERLLHRPNFNGTAAPPLKNPQPKQAEPQRMVKLKKTAHSPAHSTSNPPQQTHSGTQRSPNNQNNNNIPKKNSNNDAPQRTDLAVPPKQVQKLEENLMTSMTQSMVSFQKDNPEMTPQQFKKAWKHFSELDRENKGYITVDQFAEFQRRLLAESVDSETAKAICQETLRKIYEDSQMTQTITGLRITKQDLAKHYTDIFEKPRQELISRVLESARQSGIFERTQQELKPEDLKQCLQEFENTDLDENGFITPEEFYQIIWDRNPDLPNLLVDYVVKRRLGEATKITKQEFVARYQELVLRQLQSTDTQHLLVQSVQHNIVKEKYAEFTKAETFATVLQRFAELKNAAALPPDTPPDTIFSRLMTLVTRQLPGSAYFWRIVNEQLKNHTSPAMKKYSQVLVVGAGPAGLRTAIELALFGGRVTLLERRKKFSRNSVLLLWPSTIRDFAAIGGKQQYHGGFATGNVSHATLKFIQLALLRVALILGVRIEFGVTFHSLEPVSTNDPSAQGLYNAICTGRDKQEKRILCNALVGCDGGQSKIATKENGFDISVVSAKSALAITANFKNSDSQAERNLSDKPGVSAYNDRPFFEAVKKVSGADLENIVYYKGHTHYIVMTIKRNSLADLGIVKDPSISNPVELIASHNINRDKMLRMVEQIACNVLKIPHKNWETRDRKGHMDEDCALFEFGTSKKLKGAPAVFLSPRFLVVAGGDAIVTPNWTEGTGMNRCVLGALDTTFFLKRFFEQHYTSPNFDETAQRAFLKPWAACTDKLKTSNPSTLHSQDHKLDPKTRYKNLVGFN